MPTVTPIINPTTFAPARFGTIGTFTNILIPIGMLIGAVLFFVVMVRGSFMYITSEGSADKIAKAQKMFVYGFLGLAVVIGSYIFVKIIAFVLRIDLPL